MQAPSTTAPLWGPPLITMLIWTPIASRINQSHGQRHAPEQPSWAEGRPSRRQRRVPKQRAEEVAQADRSDPTPGIGIEERER